MNTFLKRTEIDLNECEHFLKGNWDRSKRVWTLSERKLRSILLCEYPVTYACRLDETSDGIRPLIMRQAIMWFLFRFFSSFRAATGENWHYIMLACSSDAYCAPDVVPEKDPGETCGSVITYLYFISFVFLCSFLVSWLSFLS